MPFFSSYCKTLHGALLVTTAAFLCTAFFLGWWRTNNQYAQQQADTWVLVGGITNTTAEFRSLGLQTLDVSKNPQFLNPVFTLDDVNDDDSLPQAITVTGLQPSTQYYYVVNNALIGRFRTPSTPGTRQNLTVALGGCAMTGSTSGVFDRIRRKDPDLFLHLGDLHYEDIAVPDLERRIDAISTVLGSTPQAQLYRSTGLVSMWDDHDWLGNNAAADTVVDAGSAIPIARQSYTMAFPHYPLAAAETTTTTSNDSTAGIYHAFTWGTVRFVVSDLRSESTADYLFNDEQRDWLQREISQADDYDFLVWVTTKPWIGGERTNDAWSKNPEDRAQISEWLSAVPSRNVLAVSADAHMLALDNGRNTYYGSNHNESDVVYSFPLLHSGPLDRMGSAKGGPYTQQCVAADDERNHQYSVLSFSFPEDQDPCLRIEAFRFTDFSGEELVFEQSWCGELYGAADTTGALTTDACTIPSYSPLTQGLFYTAVGLLVLSLIAALWLVRPWPETIGISIIMVVGWGLVVALAAYLPVLRGYSNTDVQPAFILVGVQAAVYLLLVFGFRLRFQRRRRREV